MDQTTETPAAAPTPELSIDEIVAQALTSSEATGDAVVKEDGVTQGGSEPAGAHTADPAGSTPAPATETAPAEPASDEPKADDVTAARVRKMLAQIEERETALAAREAHLAGGALAELLKGPKAFLAKHGKSIDDVIDASVAEGAEPPVASAAEDNNPRLTALEKRISDRERAEQMAQQDAAINARKVEIHGEISKSTKFPLINETKRQTAVTDFMVEYHAIHGKAISWDKAAALVESDLGGVGIAAAKKLGWVPPPAKATDPPKERPGTVSIGGDQRTAAPTTGEDPEDPNVLMDFLVKQAGLKAG